MAMSKREMNIKAAELQSKVDRISNVRERALKTAAAAVDRKYRKQLTELLTGQEGYSTVDHEPGAVKELQERIELPAFFTQEELAEDEVEELTEGQRTGVWTGYEKPEETSAS